MSVGSERKLESERRAEILDTAATVFASSGLRASLQQIADACGILPGSLYHHFESKEGIFLEEEEEEEEDAFLRLPRAGVRSSARLSELGPCAGSRIGGLTMADSAAFEAACASLEERGALDRLVARGTIRLVLKEAGLEPKTVTGRELGVAVKRLLPAALSARGVPEPESLCASVAKSLESVGNRAGDEAPEAIFARLAGS